MKRFIRKTIPMESAGHRASSVGGDIPATWNFKEGASLKRWTLPNGYFVSADGGAIWLRMVRPGKKPGDDEDYGYQIWGAVGEGADACRLVSPPIRTGAADALRVRMQILNRSPESDGSVCWRPGGAGGQGARPVRFAMRPNSPEWQTVECVLPLPDSVAPDGEGELILRVGSLAAWGDLWLREVAITADAPASAVRARRLFADDDLPRISIPGLRQDDLVDAFRVLDEAMIWEVPSHGFMHPFVCPGGVYSGNWWLWDSSVAARTLRWVNPRAAEDMIRGFIEIQSHNPDGRIDLWGSATTRGRPSSQSQYPSYLEAACVLAAHSRDAAFQTSVHASTSAFLDWWLSPLKCDPATGLVRARFEESFHPENTLRTGVTDSVARLDTTVEVAVGCWHIARLAAALGREHEAHRRRESFGRLSEALNRHAWSESRGCYFDYDVVRRAQTDSLTSATFFPLQKRIAPDDRARRLVDVLTDPATFNWGRGPLTSIARTEPSYVEWEGAYTPPFAWSGDLWTGRNLPVVAGLRDSGFPDHAAELAWATLRAFAGNWAEFLHVSSGIGHGVKRYPVSAAQWIQLLIEDLLGIRCDTHANGISISPLIPRAWEGRRVGIRNLRIPFGNDARLSVHCTRREETLLLEVGVAGATIRPEFHFPRNAKVEIIGENQI